jgi:error-prone DNA polymerase
LKPNELNRVRWASKYREDRPNRLFAELLACSNFSFLRGASHPEEMVERAHELGLLALGLCDREGLYGSVRGHDKAQELGQGYLVGAELSLDLATHDNENDGRTRPAAADFGRKHPEFAPTLILYPEHHRGYRSLCRAITLAHQDRPKGTAGYRIFRHEVPAEGLVYIVPADSLLALDAAQAPDEDDEPSPVERVLARLSAEAPKQTYLGHFRHFDAEDPRREALIRHAHERFGFPILASARPRFHSRKRRPLADVLDCIRRGVRLDEAGRFLHGNSEARLLSEAEIRNRFADQLEWVNRTEEVVERCSFSLSELDYKFPCHLEPGETADEKLKCLVKAGARRRYPRGVPEKVKQQLKHEIDVIAGMQMASYFLSTWEVVQMAKARQILCQGRGSAANSAVCFVLGITGVDPARSSLLFERFMSPERREPPDIDIDFEHERREEIIQDIYREYGRDRAAMVSEVIRYRARSALREVAKAFGLSPDQIDRLTSAVSGWESLLWVDPDDDPPKADSKAPRGAADAVGGAADAVGDAADAVGGAADAVGGAADAVGGAGCPTATTPRNQSDRAQADGKIPPPVSTQAIERLRALGLDANDPRLRRILRLAKELQGFPRHLSIHVGGFVLSAEPIESVCPVEPGRMPGRTVVPWDKDDIDRLGFFKVDILGLGMLTAIRKSLELLHEDGHVSTRGNPDPVPFCPIECLATIPAEDPVVYNTISRGDTMGVFQIESRAQMAMLPRLRPQCFYDLVIEVAIVRPGPIHGGMVHPYLRRRNHREEIDYAHPSLEGILKRTLGVPLFQEQVMQIAIVGAGYTGGEADQLRRDMAAWRKNGRLLRHRERLLEGFARKGIASKFGEALFEQIKGFGEYGFPESHAASFALLVYTSAWIKTHFPAHFLVALLNAQPMGFYSPHSLVRDAVAHGVTVLDVDVSISHWDVTLEGPPERRCVRLGFRLMKGLGPAWIAQLVEERNYRPFADLEDFRLRLCPPRDTLARLAEAGAFESLSLSRRAALWEARRPAFLPLFAKAEGEPPTRSPRLPKLDDKTRLRFDYSTKGLSLSAHPMQFLRASLRRRGVITAAQLPRYHKGDSVFVAGLVLCRQQPMTANGIIFITVEDESGSINLIVRPEVQTRYGSMLRQATLLLAWGKLERTDPEDEETVPVIHVLTQGFQRLDEGDKTLAGFSRDFH